MLCWSLKNFVTDGMKDSGSFEPGILFRRNEYDGELP